MTTISVAADVRAVALQPGQKAPTEPRRNARDCTWRCHRFQPPAGAQLLNGPGISISRAKHDITVKNRLTFYCHLLAISW
ncbi:MAG TPA: hypothetical protein VGY56_00195 [Verrucomicrobiae bacterium]|nr:hypothetical protein [Verrucomicrobiae bacterium]